MPVDADLRETVTHGTKKNPITAIHFTSGPGTFYPDSFFVQRHWHSNIEILFIRRGSFSLELNLENHCVDQGDICIFNSGELHQLIGQGPGTVHDVLIFDPKILDFSYPDEWQEGWIGPFLSHSLLLPHILHPNSFGYGKVCDILEQMLALGIKKQEGWYLQCKILLLQLFAYVSENNLLLPNTALPASEMQKINRYKTIVSYIEEHYSEPVTLQQIAATIPCNPQYLCRFFKTIAGITPIQYLIQHRIERASFLLANTSQPVLEIALDCGFENISYFIRKFKEILGCTPKEYREKKPV